MNEKFITFPQDHQLPSKDDLRGKVYYKYHNAWNHSTKSCWSFRSVIQDRVNKEVIVNFLGEKEVIVKFLGEKEVTMKFLGEKEVAAKFPMEGTNHISLNYLTLLTFFKLKEIEESLVEVKQKQPTTDEGCIYKGIIIEPSKESRPQKVVLEKPTLEMTKTHSMSNLLGELP